MPASVHMHVRSCSLVQDDKLFMFAVTILALVYKDLNCARVIFNGLVTF